MCYAYWLLVVMNFNVVLCNGWSDVCGALVLLHMELGHHLKKPQ